MITFRYHLVSIGAVLLALAAGVALGAGVLDESRLAPDGDDSGSVRDTALVSFEDGYAARTAGGLIDDSLNDRSVVVMTLPGAREDEVAGIRSDLEEAGASVTGTVGLTGKLLDPANRQFAESVAGEASPDADGEGYARIGTVLGDAYLGEDGSSLDEGASTVVSAFTEGELIDVEDAPESRASLAVVVAGPSRTGDGAEVLTAMVRSLDGAGDAAVVAGPASSSREGGVVDVVRRDAAQVSSVDVTDSAAGRAVAVLALAKAADGETGAWGTSRSADGALPQ